jgi:hypothetical protein
MIQSWTVLVITISIWLLCMDRRDARAPATKEVAPPPDPPAAAPDRTEDLVLPPLIARRVISKPLGAELQRHGTVLGKTPVELELPQSDEPERLTLHLAGYLEQTIELVPDQPGATYVVLKRDLSTSPMPLARRGEP